jgi:hypothetical protein
MRDVQERLTPYYTNSRIAGLTDLPPGTLTALITE